jgi:intein/homing endonuclease
MDTYSGCSHGCFTKGLKILKLSKNNKIEETDISKIKKGDTVFSFSNKLEKSKVVYKNKRYANKLIEIETESGKKIIATEEHPIFTKLGGWVEAEDLKIGDKVLVIEQSDKQYLNKKIRK